jgi:hypothetical protein
VTELEAIVRVEPWRFRPDKPGAACIVGEGPGAGIWFATIDLGPG